MLAGRSVDLLRVEQELSAERQQLLAQGVRTASRSPIPRGSVSAVYRCRMADGRPAVLKASPDRARAWHSRLLRCGPGTPRTPAVILLDAQLGALVLEAIQPGTPLDLSLVHPSADRVAELLSALHESGVPDRSYPTARQRAAYLFVASAMLYERHPELTALIPPQLYERGHRLAARLAAPLPGSSCSTVT
jgi:hypothetical protein